jgi:MFS family permease
LLLQCPFADIRRTLFRDWKFIAVFFTGFIATFPFCVPPFFLPIYAQSLGYAPDIGAALVAGFNLASALGRIICGFGGDKIGPLNSLLATILLSALSMLCLWSVSTSLAPLIAFVIINGMGSGGFFAIMPTVVSNVFGSVRVANVMGTVVSSWTFGYLFGAPIAGYMLDAYGGESAGFKAYRPAIFYAGSLALASAGIVAYLRFKMSKDPLKRL